MNIFENLVVAEELSRIKSLDDFEKADIENLSTNLKLIENLLNDNLLEGILINSNMWFECHDSLDRIVENLNLYYDLDKSLLDDYQLYIYKR